MSHLLSKRLDGILNERLFSVDIKTTIPLRSQLRQCLDSFRELVEVDEIGFIDACKLLGDLFDELGTLGLIEVEEMAICVTSNVSHLSVFV